MTGFKIFISFTRVFLLFLLFQYKSLTYGSSCDTGACCANGQDYGCGVYYDSRTGITYCGQGMSLENGVTCTAGCESCHLPTTAPTFKPTMPTIKPTTFQPTLSHIPTVKPTLRPSSAPIGSNSNGSTSKTTLNTTNIVVFIVIGIIAISVVGFIYYRRYRYQSHVLNEELTKKNVMTQNALANNI